MALDQKARFGVVVAAVIGLVDSVYLTWIKFTHNEASCLVGIGNCEAVNTSRYAEIGGIPIALLGALAYLILLVLVLLEVRKAISAENSSTLIFGIGLAGFLYSLYLTYLELMVIKAICPFCILSAVAMTAIFILAVVRLFLNRQNLKT
jgi:uncharacterized membrane protein